MELLYIYYHAPHKSAKYILLLFLGEHAGKLIGILSEAISDNERSNIRVNSTMLTQMTMPKRIEWLKGHCPNAVRKGFRTIGKSNATIVNRYTISS